MNIGDLVQWTHVRDRGSSITLNAMEGKILEINGERAIVKNRASGRKYEVRVSRLRMMDQENELTELVMRRKPNP